MNELTLTDSEVLPDPLTHFMRRARRAKLVGTIVILLFFGCFGVWAAVARLDSAAVAPGKVQVLGNSKIVQHLEGGIVKEILIKEGDVVHEGEVLVRLDKTRALSVRDSLMGQYLAELALEARLIAERDGTPDVAFPAALTDAARSDPASARLMASQEEIFKAQGAQLSGQIDILNQQMTQKREQIGGLEQQVKSVERQSELIAEEAAAVKGLYEKHLETKPRLLALLRQQADLQGTHGANSATIAQLRESVGELKLRILDLQHQQLNTAVSDLRDTQVQLADLREKLDAAEDVLTRTDIRAPVSGVVMNMKFFTVGGVIAPGAPVVEIVPQNQKLVIEAQLSPLDIDRVHDGLPAEVRFTGLNRRTTPTVEGKVSYVSADRIDDPKGQTSYYETYIEVDPKMVMELTGVPLYPGMPTESMILTGKRTPLDYLISPIIGNMGRALKER